MATSEFDPIALARAEAIDTAHEPEDVGEFVTSESHDDGVTDFRFEALMKGYEGWQWSVTLYHDVELDHWTIDESSLIPTDKALLPPKWVPWKDRLLPSDLSVTDSIGTPEDDERLDDGIGIDEAVSRTEELNAEQQAAEAVESQEAGSPDEQADALTAVEDVVEAVEELDLSRRHVLSELGQTQTAQRWYEGPHGPKSLSTKTADGNLCSTCGFFIPLTGSLKTMFGVCANRWSPDDGKVVSVDHGCGEHSEIRPPEPSRMWVQTKPAYDDLHIDVVAQQGRDERKDEELLESLDEIDAESLAELKQKTLSTNDDPSDVNAFSVESVPPQDSSDAQEPEGGSTAEPPAAAEIPEGEDSKQIDSVYTSETVIAEEAGE
ncbi:DUF3027 domain-containing protein [Bifidobacterium animalis]|nr:DUF3027 domain-containing protein [Bifidobacterium animalis]